MPPEQATESSSTQEGIRLKETLGDPLLWRRWGPYVSERSWGTVREDYSPAGTAWDFLTHDMARSKAYRWGEDGLAGICDRYQILVFSLALWNERDPILKERAFGLTPAEGNHGEDLKEYYFYLDNTPTHSYMKYLYKYPQAEYPYERLLQENRSRGGRGLEFELLDTGVFDEARYFDVFVEYAKASAEDMCIRIEAINRGLEAAPLHIIPQLWFRNTWGWGPAKNSQPRIAVAGGAGQSLCIVADDANAPALPNLMFDYRLGKRYLYGDGGAELLFTGNETNSQKLYGIANQDPYVKDAFHLAIVNGEQEAVNPEKQGTKACFHYSQVVGPGASFVVHLR
ncbi:MAG: glucosidase, partial [Bryobacteraceae bacterium]